MGGGHPALAQAQTPVRAIITFRAEFDQDAYTEAVTRSVGATPLRHLHIAHGLVAELTPAQALALRQRNDVEYVEPVMRVHATGYPASAFAKPASGALASGALVASARGTGAVTAQQADTQQITWGIAQINAPSAWAIEMGYGVKVGVLDSGIDLSHPDLVGNIHGGVNVITDDTDEGVSYNDDCGPGTHVSGIIAAQYNTFGVAGVAPKAWLYAIKGLDMNGEGTTPDLIAGLEWAVNNGMQVVNMSWALESGSSHSLQEAIIAAYNAGVVLVAAAGNSGGATEIPAAYPQVISVSCLNQDARLAYFSSYGKVDLSAPGVNILSCFPPQLQNPNTYATGSYYVAMSGTSMSSAFVTGTVALFLSKHPHATPAMVRAELKKEATPIGYNGYYGAGEVDAYLAALGAITKG
jgi:subtilisin family serine protease